MTMRADGWLMILAATAGVFAVGCAAPPPAIEPTVSPVHLPDQEAYDRLWDVTQGTLLDHYFRLDRRDRQEGVITTYRETAASIWEIWRPMPVDPYHRLENNLHTIQHQVLFSLQRTDEPGLYEARVEVERYRYSLEERQVDNAAAGLRLFSSAAPTMSGEIERPEDAGRWINLGRDAEYERRLLEQILGRYQSMEESEQAAGGTPATAPASS